MVEWCEHAVVGRAMPAQTLVHRRCLATSGVVRKDQSSQAKLGQGDERPLVARESEEELDGSPAV
jgi:hypothetical protein